MYTLGIDIGSTSSKLAIIDHDSTIIVKVVATGGAGTSGPARVIDEAFKGSGLNWDNITRTIATGYGRMGFTQADKQISEITCHGIGVHYLTPSVRTIIDIGGQDVKAIGLTANGLVSRFQMNDKCAAGTGRFLEVMARVLEREVDELGTLAQEADQVIDISNTCAVFAESEVISRLAAGVKPANVAAGIHQSVARRVASLASRVGVVPDVVLTGGVAKNNGIVLALSEALQLPVLVSPSCQFTGAIGAALIALKEVEKLKIQPAS